GPTSTGLVTIRVEIAARAVVLKLGPVASSPTASFVGANESQSVWVWINTPTKRYTITASAMGTGGDFVVDRRVGTPAMVYTVRWPHDSGRIVPVSFTAAAGLAPRPMPLSWRGRSQPAGSIEPGGTISGVAHAGILTLIVAPE